MNGAQPPAHPPGWYVPVRLVSARGSIATLVEVDSSQAGRDVSPVMLLATLVEVDSSQAGRDVSPVMLWVRTADLIEEPQR